MDVDIDDWYFDCLKEVSKSVQVLLNSTEAVVLLTSIERVLFNPWTEIWDLILFFPSLAGGSKYGPLVVHRYLVAK